MKLSTYFRSSAAWRVRIALGLKGLARPPDVVHLLREGGEQRRPGYRAKNPTGLAATRETDAGKRSRSRSPSSSGWRRPIPRPQPDAG